MTPIIIGSSVTGDSHIRRNTERQDSFIVIDGKRHILDGVPGKERYKSAAGKYYLELSDDIKLVAVADGHGSSACPYSKTGSKTAVNVFCDIMVEYATKFSDDMNELFKLLNNEGETTRIAKRIVGDWDERILNIHKLAKREVPMLDEFNKDGNAVWKMYGTTLLGLMITPQFIYAMQLGDGDITYIDKNGVSPVIEGDKILGVETHSISKPSSWKKILTRVINLEGITEAPFMYILSTDGWLNSHSNDEEFYRTCKDYFLMIQEHGTEVVESNLAEWLSETSKMGCGDDITAVFAYFQ